MRRRAHVPSRDGGAVSRIGLPPQIHASNPADDDRGKTIDDRALRSLGRRGAAPDGRSASCRRSSCWRAASPASRRPTAPSTPSWPWTPAPRASAPGRSSRPSAAARTWGRWPGCRSASRTCRRPLACARRWARCCYKDHVPASDAVHRRQHPQGRRSHPGQDQHARVRRRRQHHQPRLRADRQSLRSNQDMRRLVGRLGRRAGAGPGAARHRHRLRRQPAHAGRVLRRGRLPPLARRGADHRSPGRLEPVQRHGADGRARSPTRTCCCTAQIGEDKADPFSSSDYARIPAELTGVDLGQVRAAVSPDLGCAPVDRAIARIFGERVATLPLGLQGGAGARARFLRRARGLRGAARRAVRGRCTASGWSNRASCSTATSSTTSSAA